MKIMKSIALTVGSLFVLPVWAQGKDLRPEQIGMAMMRLQTSPFTQEKSNFLREENLWANLRQGFRMNEVNLGLVRSHENKFASNSAYFNRTITRSQPYMYHIANEVKKRGMPAEIALLPFIESAFVTKAKSHVGASGLWQFMPATGRHYGLEQTPLYDGRHDVYAATDAALNYLQYLYGLFGDWSLALAAYNWGEGNVTRAINRAVAAGLEPTYENLKMPNETRNYVPKLLAVRNLVNNPSAFGLTLPEIKSEPYFKAVTVNTPLDIMAAAHLANISESEFLALNPAFKTPVFIPKGNRQMLLPVHAVKTFERNYKDSDKNTLLSWDVFTPDSRMSLSDIAAQTGNSVSELQRLNGISGSFVNAGRSILVNKGKASNIGSFIDFTKADFDPIPDTFMEQAPVLSQNNLIAATKPVTQPVFVQTSITTPKEASASNDVVTQIATAPVQPSPETKLIVETTTVQTAAITVEQPQTDFVAQTVAASIAQPETNIAQTSTEPIAAPEENDALLQLAITSQERIRAAEAVRESLAQSDAAEEKLRLANEKRLASEAKKKQQLAATEKAKAEALAKAKPSTHKVGNGETLYSIAKQYNLNVADLVAGNHLKGNSIQKGQVLKVSFDKKDKTQPIKAVEKKSDKHKNTIPVSYTVRKGDTLQTIAERYNLKVADIKKLNKGSNNIKAGQTLKLGAS